MSEQPEALRLADALDVGEISYTGMRKAAAELRRLSAVNAELLDALKQIVNSADDHQAAILTYLLRQAHAAITKAEGQI